MRSVLVAAAILLLCQSCIRAEKDLSANPIADTVEAVHDFFHPPQPTTRMPLQTTVPSGGSTVPPSGSSLPPTTTQAPNYLNIAVSANQANLNQPLVEQAGSNPDLFPLPTNAAFNLGPNTARYLVIGDWGRTAAAQSVGAAQCSADAFGGDNELQGGAQQAESAQLADQVCGFLGGCQAVIGTGDNFYECGVYPNDPSRFQSDWANIYQTAKTPNLNGLTWYQTFGNHDIVINGSVQTQIGYTTANPKWQIPQQYFSVDLPTVANGPKIKAFFIDSTPFIAAYNTTGNKYNTAYFQANLNPAYIDAQIKFLTDGLAASTADYNIVVSHFPLFGTSAQYGADQTGKATSPYPGNYNAWQKLLTAIYNGKATAYMNGHDHAMSAGNPSQAGAPIKYNGHTVFLTSGAGSYGEPADSCASAPDNYFYSNGGNGGFIIVSANATTFQSDFFTLGSLFSQCTITAFADKTKAPIVSDNCSLGVPNACCGAPNSNCYR
ncbi:probable tartrate-resistant acid phosphatase type 5 [Coccomyxa sp. Obi]|nr:probable tartrate-resistant acid phosphatase type 5 [Coccomyxa sp. Obi]